MKLLGIGSRIVHPELGKGVVVNVSTQHYWVSFMDSGIETIDLDGDFEVIEALHDEVDTISFSEVETSRSSSSNSTKAMDQTPLSSSFGPSCSCFGAA